MNKIFNMVGLIMGYFVHDSSYVDENVTLGEGTKVWHFSHIQKVLASEKIAL